MSRRGACQQQASADEASVSKGPGMIHVDDSLLLLPLKWARECFIPVIEQRFQITYELAYEVGHSFSFLKRLHTITSDGIVVRQPSSYIEQMKTIMNVKQNNSSESRAGVNFVQRTCRESSTSRMQANTARQLEQHFTYRAIGLMWDMLCGCLQLTWQGPRSMHALGWSN